MYSNRAAALTKLLACPFVSLVALVSMVLLMSWIEVQ